MIRTALAAIVGVAALGVGIAAIVDPGSVGASIPATSVAFVGIVPLILAYRVLVRRYRRPRYRARTGDPERAAVSNPPGRDISETAAAFLASEYVPTRRGLRAVAVAVLAHYTDATAAAAQTALAEHAWTEDPYAIAYFAESDAPDVPFLDRLRDRLRPESAYRRQLRHATDAIAAIAGVDSPPEPTVHGQWLERFGSIGAQTDDQAGGRLTSNGVSTAETEPQSGSDETTGPTSPWETGHLRGASVVALVAGGVGALFREPTLVLAGVLGVGVAAYARASMPPEPSLAVERQLDDAHPAPGDVVDVTVTVSNRGDRALTDLRLIDGVPAALPVASGSPRCGTVLPPGDSRQFSYAVEARRGEHSFDPLLAIARDVAGTHEAVTRVERETRVTCRPRRASVRWLPLRRLTTASHGNVPTTTGGEGIEFHSVREYRRDDPLGRIDWNRRARTGEFATLEFREERATAVVCLIDARASAYVTHHPDAPHAVDRAVEAADAIATTLLERGNRVGVTALGPTECWLAPATGRDHRVRLRELFVTHEAFDPTPPTADADVAQQVTALRRRLPADAQTVLFSPLVDEPAVTAARRLDACGYSVAVVSPDPTATRTAPQRLARAVRRMRIGALRRSRVPVVDWRAEESLPTTLARASERWSR